MRNFSETRARAKASLCRVSSKTGELSRLEHTYKSSGKPLVIGYYYAGESLVLRHAGRLVDIG